MIDVTTRVALDADLDDVLAVDDHLTLCERCGTFVDDEDSGDSEVTTETICLSCYIAEQAEQEAIRAEVNADLDAMHDLIAGMDLEDQLDTLLAVADGKPY